MKIPRIIIEWRECLDLDGNLIQEVEDTYITRLEEISMTPEQQSLDDILRGLEMILDK